MVKNTHGGNKSKGMARKNVQSNTAPSAQLRLPADEFEQIAFVTRVLGNGMFYANNTDGIQFLGHIRNKFKGRSRRNNDVSVGKLVLIGLRSWESSHKNADLLFVYDDLDFHTLSSLFDLSSFHFTHDNLILDFTFAELSLQNHITQQDYIHNNLIHNNLIDDYDNDI